MTKTAHIVFCHESKDSLCRSLVGIAQSHFLAAGWQIETSDLLGDAFNAVLRAKEYSPARTPLAAQLEAWKSRSLPADIAAEVAKLSRADLVLFVFPVWWFSVPATLKGWVDRVFLQGFAWGGDHGSYSRGGLRGKDALVMTTWGASERSLSLAGPHVMPPSEQLHHFLHGTLAFCGLRVAEPFTVFDAEDLTQPQFQDVLARGRAWLASYPDMSWRQPGRVLTQD